MFSLILVFISLLVFNIFGNATESLIVSSIILITVLTKTEHLMKRSIVYYVISFITCVISLIFYENSIFNLINSGVVGLSFFLIVMFTGLLPRKLSITKSLVKFRKDLSILGFILISPHALIRLFNNIDLVGVVVYVIMIPLFLTSFNIVRKEMQFKEWKNLHKASYIVYILIFIHLLIVANPFNRLIYIVLATLYINNKIIFERKR